MSDAGVRSRNLWGPTALAAILSAILVAPPTAEATTGGISFGEVSWVVDDAVGTTSFSVEAVVAGAMEPDTPCGAFGWCLLTLEGTRVNPDGSTGDVVFLASGGFLRPSSGDFPVVLSGARPVTDLTHVKLALFDARVTWSTGFVPIPGQARTVVVGGVTDDLLTLLSPFLDGLEWARVDDTVELSGDVTVAADLAGRECSAAVEALDGPGRSKGKRIGTIDETQTGLATLCVLLSEVAETPVPEAVDEALSITLPPRGKPGGSEDVPGTAAGLDDAPGINGDG